MGLLDTFFRGRTKLTTQDRNTIFKLFGSFRANQLGNNSNTLLTEGYESNVDVYSVIKKITDVTKAVPYIVEEKTSEGWVELKDSTIHELMLNPNRDKGYTWDDIEEMLLIYLLANGNSYLVGQEGLTSIIREVDVLPSPNMEITTGNDFFMPNANYEFILGSQTRNYNAEQIEHIRLFNPSYNSVSESFVGLSAIAVARKVVQVGNDRWDADASLLQNRGAIGLITDKSQRPMLPEEAQQVQEGFDRDTAGTHNYGKVKVTNKDLSFIQMAMSSTDLQLVEKGVINLRAMCNVFGLDSSLFNDPANKTFNNRKEAEKSLYTNAIMPISDKIVAKHNQFLVKNHYPSGNVRLRKDFSEVEALQSDKKLEAEKDKIIMDGINVVVNMPISSEGKARLLEDEYGIAPDQAELLLKPEGTKNNTLEVLKSLSPLLANKLVDKLSEEEIRGLFGLEGRVSIPPVID